MDKDHPHNAAGSQSHNGSALRSAHFLMILPVFLGIGLAMATVAYAQTSVLSLAVTPNSIALNPGEAAQVIVVANIPVTTVQSVTLTAFTHAGAVVSIQDPAHSRQPLQGDLTWTITITRADPGSPTGKVFLRANYLMQTGGGPVVAGVSTASVEIQDRVQEAMDKVVIANLETALDSIQDLQSRQAFVVVKNISRVPITVTRIVAWPIPMITSTVQDLGSGYPLAPQETHPFTMTLNAGDAVQTGKHLLVVQMDAEWTLNGQRMTGSTVLNKEFQAGVFGESAILQATGIPSLMLLPGFLFLITLTLIVKYTWKKSLLDLDFKKPEFWYIAITISLLAVWGYPTLTGPFLSRVLGQPMSSRDLLQGYGFNDILLLWLGAVVFGLLVWAVGSTLLYMALKVREAQAADRARQERQRRERLIPTRNDLPLIILRKIANNRKGLDLEQKRYIRGNESQPVFVLPTGYPEEGKVWVAPRIKINWRNADEEQKDQLDKARADAQSIRDLIDMLEEWQNRQDPIVELGWDKAGPLIRGPEQVDETQVKEMPITGDSFFAPA
jgi:hypothetical protein